MCFCVKLTIFKTELKCKNVMGYNQLHVIVLYTTLIFVLAFSQILLLFVAVICYVAVSMFCYLESQITLFLLRQDCTPIYDDFTYFSNILQTLQWFIKHSIDDRKCSNRIMHYNSIINCVTNLIRAETRSVV